MSHVSISRLPVGRLAHPLLRFALDGGVAAKKLKQFNKVLRASLRGHIPERQRIVYAREVLRQVSGLELDQESSSALRLEWLRIATAELVDDPVLLEELALAELAESGIDVHPVGWWDPSRQPTSCELPYLRRKLTKDILHVDIRAASDAWCQILECSVRALQSDRLTEWGRSECLAAYRALVLSCIASRPGHHRDPSERLAFLEGLGTVLWRKLVQRLLQLSDDGMDSLWFDAMRNRTLLHLAGILQANEPLLGAQRPTAEGEAGVVGTAPCLRIVIDPIPPATEKYDKEALKSYEPLTHPLPLVRMPSRHELSRSLEQLRCEFPWVPQIISRLEDLLLPPCLLGVKHLKMRPVLLVGRPGAGKTRLARRVAEVLNIPYIAVPCGGSGDSKLLSGTARGWASGQPTPILSFLLRRKSSSAFVLLDEIDKVVANHHGSPPLSSILLGLLEPETAKRWRDGYLQADCDLSGVTFWGTANSLGSIPKALLTRFEVIHVAEPRIEHFQSLADNMTREIEEEWLLPINTLPRIPVRGVALRKSASARELRSWLQRELADYVRNALDPGCLH